MILDQDILSDIQSLVAEPRDGGVTWPSKMWSAAEVVHHLNDVQQTMVVATGCVLTRVTIPCTPHHLRHDLPEDFLEVQRLVWVRSSDNRHYPLYKMDTWELDAAASSNIGDWRNAPGVPAGYTVGDLPTRTIQIAPAASVPGVLQLTYLAIPTSFTGSGVAAAVPDEATVGLVWAAIQHMFTKEGRAKDTVRAQIAEGRGKMIQETLKLLLEGWED